MIRKDKILPDYSGDRYWANILAKRIQSYHHSMGNTLVKVWVEARMQASGRHAYDIRSNIVYNCDKI